MANGKVEDWGRVGAAAAGGAVAGALTAAVPAAGYAAVMGLGAASGVAGGATTRLVESGGKSAGTLSDVVGDAVIGAVTAGAVKGGAAVIVHDPRNKGIAAMLIEMPDSFPVALGVIYEDPAPTFEAVVREQNEAAAKGKAADLQALVSKGQTWMVEKEPHKL